MGPFRLMIAVWRITPSEIPGVSTTAKSIPSIQSQLSILGTDG
jgi:hypothetical protein